MTPLLVLGVLVALGACVWLGYELAKSHHELRRVTSLTTLQLNYIRGITEALANNQKLLEIQRRISEAKDENDLNAIYNDIIS